MQTLRSNTPTTRTRTCIMPCMHIRRRLTCAHACRVPFACCHTHRAHRPHTPLQPASAICEDWCDPNWAKDHCRYCKCRGCAALADKCAAISDELEREERKRAELFDSCGSRLDCLSWCNIGNCVRGPTLPRLPTRGSPS